jgi:hypothetical protein
MRVLSFLDGSEMCVATRLYGPPTFLCMAICDAYRCPAFDFTDINSYPQDNLLNFRSLCYRFDFLLAGFTHVVADIYVGGEHRYRCRDG